MLSESKQLLSPAAVVRRSDHALLVSPHLEDQAVLQLLFRRRNWTLSAVRSLESARQFLRNTVVPVVITECEPEDNGWKRLLAETRDLPRAPLVVMISGRADEHLWSEVLNLGGHDLLAKPLCESDFFWVIEHAFQRWTVTHDQASNTEPRCTHSRAGAVAD